jgi:hypothetical protein
VDHCLDSTLTTCFCPLDHYLEFRLTCFRPPDLESWPGVQTSVQSPLPSLSALGSSTSVENINILSHVPNVHRIFPKSPKNHHKTFNLISKLHKNKWNNKFIRKNL